MGKLFGTDGIRGIVGENLTAELAYRTGQAVTVVLREELKRDPVITIGMDTRISSDMLEGALIAGICAAGGNVLLAGVLPTPAAAFLCASCFALISLISASACSRSSLIFWDIIQPPLRYFSIHRMMFNYHYVYSFIGKRHRRAYTMAI